MDDAILLGAHVSTAGGVPLAPTRAGAIGATAMQMFSKMANRWAERDCDDDECVAYRAALSQTDVVATAVHDSYLINLASPDPVLQLRSTISFISELKRCEALGVDFLVSHPGNYMDDRDSGIDRNVEGIVAGLECASGRTTLLLETTAGSGTAIGSSFEDLATILDRIPGTLRERVGICADTAHLFAAGYDLAGDFDTVWKRFADVIGIEKLRFLHLNDSKAPLGSRRDRHELIGEGAIGAGAFQRIMTDERFARVPKVIETPKLDDAEATDRRMLDLLRSFARVAVALLIALCIGPVAAAQPSPAEPLATWRAEIGAVAGTAFVEDGNGVTVTTNPGVFAGADVARQLRPGVALTLGFRALVAPLRAESSGRSWSAGSSRQYDLTAGLELDRFALADVAIALTATRLLGPRDVVPFRSSGAITTWGSEAIVSRRIARSRPLDGLIGARIMRVPSQPRENPSMDAGWVGQLRVGLRYAL